MKLRPRASPILTGPGFPYCRYLIFDMLHIGAYRVKMNITDQR